MVIAIRGCGLCMGSMGGARSVVRWVGLLNIRVGGDHRVTPVGVAGKTTSPSHLQIAKLIQKLANTSSVREDYMMPLEPFVKHHNEELKVRHREAGERERRVEVIFLYSFSRFE